MQTENGQKKNKYEIDMTNGTLMDKLISFSLPLMLSVRPIPEVRRMRSTSRQNAH